MPSDMQPAERVPRGRKTFAIAVIVIVLGAQLRAIVPPTFGSWYWPFMDYAMYRQARYRNEAFRLLDLDVVPCAPGQRPRSLRAVDVGIPPFRYRYALAVVADRERPLPPPRARADAARLLDAGVRPLASQGYCEARVVEQTYLNDLERSGIPDSASRPIHTWRIGSIAPNESVAP